MKKILTLAFLFFASIQVQADNEVEDRIIQYGDMTIVTGYLYVGALRGDVEKHAKDHYIPIALGKCSTVNQTTCEIVASKGQRRAEGLATSIILTLIARPIGK